MSHDAIKRFLERMYGCLNDKYGPKKDDHPRHRAKHVIFGIIKRRSRHSYIAYNARQTSRKNKRSSTKERIDAKIAGWTAVVGVYTRRLFWATAVLAVVSAGTLWAIKGQLDVMEADQRPWFKVEISPGPFVVEEYPANEIIRQIQFFPHIKAINVGKSPAYGVTINFYPAKGLDLEEAVKTQKAQCGGLRGLPLERIHGYTIFPNDYVTEDMGAGKQIIGFVRDEILKYSFSQGKRIYAQFSMVGCVDYMFGDSIKHHQTGFIYFVWQIVGKTNGEDVISPSFDIRESTPAEKIKLVPRVTPGLID